jgi:2-(1,2-epoxy-1,2-dihydrophenyl)acetyl-CoA isomerase
MALTSRTFDDLLVAQTGAVATITLNRPDKLNSFTAALHADLLDVLRTAGGDDSVRCIVITGAGKGFCAGQDLGDLDLNNLQDVIEKQYNPLIKTIAGLQKPIIACVNGVAAGAGANMALNCDMVVAARSARFIQSFSQIGLVPDGGGSWVLPRLVGQAKAMALVMTAEPVMADDAEAMGMIYKVVDDADLQTTTHALATTLAALPTTALALTRNMIRQSSTNTLEVQLNVERDYQAAASNTADFKEGVDAFLNKRKPVYTGK